jgi:hypothetical protein
MKFLHSTLCMLALATSLVVVATADCKSQTAATITGVSKLPDQIRVVLEIAPSTTQVSPNSFWEGTYEIRIVDWSEVERATQARTPLPGGEALLSAAFEHRSMANPNGRLIRISIPVEGLLLKRLRQESTRAQAFLLRATIKASAVELAQTYLFDINRVWQAALFPDGEATIKITLKPDGGYSTWGPTPKQSPGQPNIIRIPARSEATSKP